MTPARPCIRMTAIVLEVARDFEVTPDEILGPRRHAAALTARQAAAWLGRRTGWSYSALAAALNRNQHPVLEADRAAARRLRRDPEFCARVERIDRRLGCQPTFVTADQERHMTTTITCADCGAEVVTRGGRGRPRVRCDECAAIVERRRKAAAARRRAARGAEPAREVRP